MSIHLRVPHIYARYLCSVTSRWTWICRAQLSYINSSDMDMQKHFQSMHIYLNILNMLKDSQYIANTYVYIHASDSVGWCCTWLICTETTKIRALTVVQQWVWKAYQPFIPPQLPNLMVQAESADLYPVSYKKWMSDQISHLKCTASEHIQSLSNAPKIRRNEQ